MPQSLISALLAHKLKSGDSPWVFPNSFGEPFHKANVAEEFDLAIEKAGLPRIVFHGMRHTSNTLLLGKGVHTKVMQDRAGHANSGTTLDIYSHVLPPMDQEAAVAMESILAA